MKDTTPSPAEMLSEYEFDYTKAKDNHFAADYRIAVTLDPDVADVFKTSESVNKALRAILSAIPSDPNAQPDNPSKKQI